MADPNLLAILDRMQQNHAKTMQLIINLVERLAPTNNQNNHQHLSSPPSYNNISPQHRYNISTNIISPSPHLQQRDNYPKILNHLPYDSKGENFNGVEEEMNPFHGSKSLVSCDEDARHQHNTSLSTCSQQVIDRKATTPVEEHLEQPDELVDRLVTVEEIQELDDEDEANTLTDELKTKAVIVENSSNIEEVFVGNFPMLTGNLANSLSIEVQYDFLLQTKHLCSTNNEALPVNYNDPFLQPSVKPFTIEVGFSSLISRVVQWKHMHRKSNLKEDCKDLMVRDLKLYCFKEFYKEKKFGANAYRVKLPNDFHISNKFNVNHIHKYYEKDASLRTSFNQPGELDAVRIKEMFDSDLDVNNGHIRSKPIKNLYLQLEI